MNRLLTLLLPLLLLLPGTAPAALSDFGFGQEEEEFLEPDLAFAFTAESEGDAIVGRWQIAKGYYLYRDKIQVELKEPQSGITLGEPQLPQGEEKEDEFFGRIQVYHDLLEVRIPVTRDDPGYAWLKVEFKYQGCAEKGICYPPMKKEMELSLAAAAGAPPSAPPTAAVVDPYASTARPAPAQQAPARQTPPVAPAEPLSEQDEIARSLAEGNLWLVMASFLGFGLLLAFTPCVFPMVPILSSIIVGQGEGLTTRRAFVLSLTYVLAMALTYTVAGVLAGMFGSNLQAAFQEPWIVGAFAAVFVALAFSMFGFYDLQLPSSWQGRLTELSNRQQGGTLAGVAVMGLLSALIVGPCVAAPLAGALIYIGQTGDALLGGIALFALSLGMGLPLVAIGTAGGKLLPRAGAWMDGVKAVFGVLLLGVALFFLERVLPVSLTMPLWALLALVSAVYMGALERLPEAASGWRKLWKGLGVALLLYGALLLVGAATGSGDPLRPLEGLRSAAAGSAAESHGLAFRKIKSVGDLERELAAAAGRPVMLDFYADWCIACKELEKYTFPDPGVGAALAGVVLLQADVTANDESDRELMRHFGIIGPPSLHFWGGNGEEIRAARIAGFKPAAEFSAHVRRFLAP